MKSTVYQLRNLKRLTAFPYPLDEIGLMVNHFAPARNRRLERLFVCFSFHAEKYNPPEAGNRPRFSILFPGTVLNATTPLWHDELFFSYSPEISAAVESIFASVPERGGVTFFPGPEFHRNLALIRELLESRMELGSADKLDGLALQMTLSAIASAQKTAPEPNRKPHAGMCIQEIALKLKQGAELNGMIRRYGFSRRAFYYEWSKCFSVTPKQMQLEYKLEKAQELLLAGALPVAAIAEQCGFSSPRYFHACFLRCFGGTPGEYRKRAELKYGKNRGGENASGLKIIRDGI